MFTEFIKFTLYMMPCCGHELCWVNPRIPNFCPECGKKVYFELLNELCSMAVDEKAQLKVHEEVIVKSQAFVKSKVG